ncbi:MAG: zinc-dependent metalloprotease, partial [Candidatus Kapabacteria bacterium]|nr:zinc-dependent metalloprotease [Candidatus Kapabacteria bacterium]
MLRSCFRWALAIVTPAMFFIGCASAPPPAQMTDKPASEKDKKIKPYDKVITKEAVSDSGLFIVHRIDEKVFYEIPTTRLGKELLLVSRIAKTPQVGYGGEENNTEVIRWERKYDKILLRTISYVNVAADSAPISRAVKASNFEEIIRAFPIQAYNKDTSAVIIDVTDMFTSDVGILTPGRGVRQEYKMGGVDKERSYIEYAKSFPTNIEVENVVTFSAEAPSQNSASKTMSFTMHHSMVALPENPMLPRLADPRVGFFSLRQTDYARPESEAVTREYILRWRLEPKDTAAFQRGELVEPIKPITYYIDPATPVKWRSWLKKGIEDWNPAFEVAGFKNAVRCIDPPTPEEDPDWSPEDARYSVIRYYPSPIENAYGPNIHDPRTGEIIESDIGWFHNIMKLQTGWFFAQAVSNPSSRKIPFPDSVMGELIRFVAAHEFGHTIGMPHNMKASSAYPVDSLRSKTFCAKYGTAPSIMDYARFNYIAQPGDDVDVMPKVGPYDKFATMWGYRPVIGAKTSDDELDSTRAWAQATERDPMLRFGSQQWMILDPSAQTEDLGDDAIKAGMYGVKNLQRAMSYLYMATYEEGKDFDQLNDSYDDIIGQWSREMGHVANIPGGVLIDRKVFGSEGVVYTPVPQARQKAAVTFLTDYVFTTPAWLIDERVVRLLSPADVASRLSSLQTRMLRTVISSDKLLRLLDQQARYGDTAYSVDELYADVEGAILTELTSNKPTDYYRRALHRAYVQELIDKSSKPAATTDAFAAMFRPNTYATDVRAISRARLAALRKRLQTAKSADPTTQAHYED